MIITAQERAAIERLAELAKIRRTLWPHDASGVAVPPVFAQDSSESDYEMACQSESIRRGLDY